MKNDVTIRGTTSNLEFGPRGVHRSFDLEQGRQERRGLNRYQHRTIAKPLGDAHAASRTDIAHHRSKRAQQTDGPLIALVRGVGREPRKVNESEVSMRPHRHMFPRDAFEGAPQALGPLEPSEASKTPSASLGGPVWIIRPRSTTQAVSTSCKIRSICCSETTNAVPCARSSANEE